MLTWLRNLYRYLFLQPEHTASVQALSLTMFSPSNYQVFQRDINNNGTILIAGQLDGVTIPVLVEYRIDGGSWITLASDVTFRFETTVTLTAGQYTVEVRADTLTATRQYVGVGDVYIVAGQSNASGRGSAKQVYSHSTLKASMYSNAYQWGDLVDWTDIATGALDTVSNDSGTAYGSVWPVLATLIMTSENIPVAFIPVAKGGTLIEQWLPSEANRFNTATLYGAMLRRFHWSGGKVKAVLWWQGESNAGTPAITPAGMYAEWLEELAYHVWNDFQCPLVAAKISQMTALPAIRTWAINRGVELAVQNAPDKVLLGADLSDLVPDDTQHLQQSVKLQTAAARWWDALEVLFYS